MTIMRVSVEENEAKLIFASINSAIKRQTGPHCIFKCAQIGHGRLQSDRQALILFLFTRRPLIISLPLELFTHSIFHSFIFTIPLPQESRHITNPEDSLKAKSVRISNTSTFYFVTFHLSLLFFLARVGSQFLRMCSPA